VSPGSGRRSWPGSAGAGATSALPSSGAFSKAHLQARAVNAWPLGRERLESL
jgi:hypothetical protein